MPRRTAIGLDIGTSVVRAAELSFGRGATTLERFGQVVLPDGAVRDGEVVDATAVAEALRHLWSATGFSHKNVMIGVANQRVVVRRLELPWMEHDELRSSLAFQVQDVLPFAVEQSVIDFFPVKEFTDPTGSRMLGGLLVAADRESVLTSVRAVEAAGLKVQSVDLCSFAVLRSMGRQTDLTVGTEALVDVGARVTNVVVHSAGVPHFVRILLMGGQDVTDAVAETMGVPADAAEALKQEFGRVRLGSELETGQANVSTAVGDSSQDFVDEIRGSIDYYAASNAGPPIERLVVSGGGSQLSGLVDLLGSALRLPVVAGNPLAPLNIGRTGLEESQLEFIQPLAAVPVGLALGAI